jgi:UDP-N-acetylglucosamine 2-epimerase (non-hydrolysing)
LGTRPEAIKLAPVVRLARRECATSSLIISTGQQCDLVPPALADFALVPDIDLQLMRPGQTLGELTARSLAGLSRVFGNVRPRLVVVQGDTASALAGAMAAFYQQVPVAHVEAGLRTHALSAPFPEEANRQLISRLATLHFAPTTTARMNLLAEGIDPDRVTVTGNTVVDALNLLTDRIQATPPPVETAPGRKMILVTAHRRENFGPPFDAICQTLCRLVELRPQLHFVFITHPNPAAGEVARRRLAGRAGITLLPPLDYLTALRLLASSWLVVTDSGGLQEEAPSFGRPVLVLRDATERPEGIAAGVARLVGTDPRRITQAVLELIESPVAYAQMQATSNPYGDGRAAERILAAVQLLLRAHDQQGLPHAA